MGQRKDGGFAFPHPGSRTDSGEDYNVYPELGMSLRDYFAAQALTGALAFPGVVNDSRDKSAIAVARAAYTYADAMLAEREKGGSP